MADDFDNSADFNNFVEGLERIGGEAIIRGIGVHPLFCAKSVEEIENTGHAIFALQTSAQVHENKGQADSDGIKDVEMKRENGGW